MRLRIPEVFQGKTPYEVVKASGGRLNEASLYRLQRAHGEVHSITLDLLEALCDVLEIAPSELFHYEPPATRRVRAKRKSGS